MPIDAKYVERCFSTASMRMTKTSCAVKKTSMKRPRVMLVPPPRTVSTSTGPGYIAATAPAAAIPATSWAGMTRTLRSVDMPPQSQSASVTCPNRQLPSNSHAVQMELYHQGDRVQHQNSTHSRIEQASSNSVERPHVRRQAQSESQQTRMYPAASGAACGFGAGVCAICVPAKAMKRKRNVPTNSPRTATMLLRVVGARCSIGREWPGLWMRRAWWCGTVRENIVSVLEDCTFRVSRLSGISGL